MTDFMIQTNIYFDCTEEGNLGRLRLAKYIMDHDDSCSWRIIVTTLQVNLPSIILTYPITAAGSVAKALTLWEETKDDN